MTPEIRHALEVIRDECRNRERPCRISKRTPDEWNIEVWEKEDKK